MNESRPEQVKNAATDLIDRRMLEQSLRVPWKQLSATVDQIVEWRAFSLWVRAIADIEGSLPRVVCEAIKKRCPGFLGAMSRGPVGKLWTELLAWSERTVFAQAVRGGWIDAAHYYSGIDPRSEPAWQHWERSAAAWASTKPGRYPSFAEWWTEAQLAGTEVEGPLVEHAIESAAYSYWAVLVLMTNGDQPALREHIELRCPAFFTRNFLPAGSDDAALGGFREALEAALVGSGPRVDEARAAARSHLRLLRVAAYFAVCKEQARLTPAAPIPAFEAWLRQADDFVTAP
ncbi:MAG: hypothetical protein K1X67_26795 [Fimbriimonadaceae bacterium]|nr:hypothetical protein [Fimbriimonadaceae bacterium]